MIKLNLLNENILDENIPKELLQAYKNSVSAARGVSSQPNSNHAELANYQSRKGSIKRRGVNWNYGKSNYDKISKKKALELLTLEAPDINSDVTKYSDSWKIRNKETFKQKIPTIRVIIDNEVIEWETKPSGSIYYAYWTYIDTTKMIIDGHEFRFKGKDGPTNDTKFAGKANDIAHIIQISDNIYETDEYEHPITPEQKEKRNKNSHVDYFTTFKGNSEPGYEPHNAANNLGSDTFIRDNQGNREKTIYHNYKIPYVRDTGVHTSSVQFRDDNAHYDYVKSLINRKNLKQALRDSQANLKQLEKQIYNSDDPDVMEDIYTKAEKEFKDIQKEYEDVCVKTKDLKARLIDDYTKEIKGWSEGRKTNLRIDSIENIEKKTAEMLEKDGIKKFIKDSKGKDILNPIYLKMGKIYNEANMYISEGELYNVPGIYNLVRDLTNLTNEIYKKEKELEVIKSSVKDPELDSTLKNYNKEIIDILNSVDSEKDLLSQLKEIAEMTGDSSELLQNLSKFEDGDEDKLSQCLSELDTKLQEREDYIAKDINDYRIKLKQAIDKIKDLNNQLELVSKGKNTRSILKQRLYSNQKTSASDIDKKVNPNIEFSDDLKNVIDFGE